MWACAKDPPLQLTSTAKCWFPLWTFWSIYETWTDISLLIGPWSCRIGTLIVFDNEIRCMAVIILDTAYMSEDQCLWKDPELWKSDGTSSGTVMVKDIWEPVPQSAFLLTKNLCLVDSPNKRHYDGYPSAGYSYVTNHCIVRFCKEQSSPNNYGFSSNINSILPFTTCYAA